MVVRRRGLGVLLFFPIFFNTESCTRQINMTKKTKRGKPSKAKKPNQNVPLDDPETEVVKVKMWKFPKFHELLHIVDDIERFGAPMNYCAQRPESLLIPVAKQPGRRAQKRHEGSVYELQAAQRLSYSIIIDAMFSRLWNTDVTGKTYLDVLNHCFS